MEQKLNEWLQLLATTEILTQLGTILACVAIAYIAHRYWQGFLVQRLGAQERTGLSRILLRGTERIVFPLTMMLLTVLARSVFQLYHLPHTLLSVVIPLALSLAAIRILVYLLRRSFSPGPLLKTWEGVISTTIWTLVALHLLGWLPGLLNALDAIAIGIGDSKLSLLSLLKFLLVAAAFVTVAGWMSRRIEQRTMQSNHISPGMRVGLIKFSKVVLYSVAIVIALDSVGIDMTSLAVFGGALGVGLGFGLQRIASNFISGFILLFDRSIRPGDVISIGERFGWVEALHARYIVVRDRDGVETLIPNENLVTSEVTNWSYSDRKVRLRLPVQISYKNDPEQAIEIMVQACQVSDRVLDDPEPVVRLMAFGDNGIELELRLWVSDPESGIYSLKSQINLEIWRRFREAGITIPYPQRDVHMIDKA